MHLLLRICGCCSVFSIREHHKQLFLNLRRHSNSISGTPGFRGIVGSVLKDGFALVHIVLMTHFGATIQCYGVRRG